MAYWWQKEEENEQSSDQQTDEQGYWWQKENFAKTIGNNITNRVNNWFNNHNSYISSYQNRTSGRKYSYEDAYVSDSGSWLDAATKQKSEYDAEADSILEYLNRYGRYLDADWVKSVRSSITGARNQQQNIVDYYTRDNEWWNSFGSDADLVERYGSAEGVYNYFQRADGWNTKYTGMGLNDLNAALSALEDSEEKDWLAYNWTQLAKETLSQYADWDERSQYATTYRGGETFNAWSGMYTDTGFDDIEYDYINRNETARGRMMVNDVASNASFLGLDTSYLKEMTDDEIAIYNYLYDPNDKTAANEYLAMLLSDLTYRQRETQEKYWAEYAHEHPVASSTFSVITSPLKGLTALGQFADYAADGTIDQNAAYNKFSYIPSSIREQVSNDIAESGKWGEVGSWTYQLGMSMGDFLMNTAVTGGNSTLSLALMGSGAMADTVISAKDRGLSDDQAMILGVVAGGAEIITEKFSLDALFKGGLEKGAVKYILTNAFTEGTEEVSSSLINLVADLLVSKDKSEWQMAINDYLAKHPNATEQEAFQNVLVDNVLSLGLDFLGGALMGGTMGTGGAVVNYVTNAAPYVQANKDAINQYGKSTDMLIQEGLGNDPKSTSYYLANKYQKQVQGKDGKGGNALTGYQIRNLLAANQDQVTAKNLELIEEAAANRLAKIGQRGDLYKIAKLATKYVTGQKLTAAEKSFLANNEKAAQVTSELFNVFGDQASTASGKLLSKWENDISQGWGDNYSTEWAEGTKSEITDKNLARELLYAMANLDADGPNAYKSLESRVEADTPAKVSNTGKAVISATGEEIDLTNPNFKEIAKDGVVLEVNGKTVNSNEIDYANEDQGLAINTIGKIEHITPMAAGALYAKLDMSKPVMAQLNGMDEAFTYGFYNYSEADLKAGLFTGNLTKEQLNDAYKLGQHVAKNTVTDKTDAVKKMRTAAEATVSKTEKAAKQKERIESDDVEVYFQDGKKVVKFDEHTGKYDEKRMAAVNTAKFLSKLGIGHKYYFFESYVNANGDRVYKDADGNEVEAPNGIYMEDGSIYIDLNAGDYGQGTALFTLGHELTHFIKAHSEKQFKVLSDLVTEAYSKTDMSMHERVVAKQDFLAKKRGHHVTYAEAYEEVVCDAMSTMMTDGSFHEKIMEIKVKDKGLFNTIKRFFENMIAKFNKAYAELTPDQKDAQDIRAMKDMFDRIQTTFAGALVEASDNFHAAMESVVEAKAEPVEAGEIITDGAVVTDGNGERFSIRSMKHDIAEGKMFEDLKKVCGWTDAQVVTLRKQLNDLVEYMIPYRNILDMNETYGMEGRRFSPYKPNSDPLYKISMDFSTLCSKRLLTQYVIENLQLRENRPMSAEEQMAIRAMLNEYRKVEKGLQVACAMCYVEAARLKSPKQIQKWMDDPATAMRNYFADKNPEFAAYIKKAQEDFKESKGYNRGASKAQMKEQNKKSGSKDVTELNKIRPKLREQYQPSAEEQAIIERAKALPNSTYLTAGNLANLSETDPVIYDAYTAFVRTATRSKSLETDEPYYYGDSRRDNGNGIVVTDSFIEAVNRENGMRFSSWSDWRIQHLLDYITAVIDNGVRGAAMHGYTKFGDEVRVLGKTGMMFNMSGVAGTQTGLNEDGSLSFSDTESIDVNEAIQLREEFPETAGLQCIGVGDAHITALLRSDIIDYVIPYHVSGLNAALRRMADIHGWKDYTSTQHAAIDKSIKLENAVDKEHWHEEPVFSEFFVGYDTGMTGIEAMRASAEKYKQMCKDRGLTPKFNQFATEDNYWKLLIDRKMINQQTGKLIKQKAVTPTFDFDAIKGVVNKFVTNYDAGLENRALNHIVENWDTLPQRIKDLKKGSKAKKAADTLANQTVAAQPKNGEKHSDRITLSMTDKERTAILNKKSLIADVYEGQAEGAIKRNKADLDSGKIGLVKSAIVRIGEEFGIFTDYDISDVDVKIQLSKSNIKESVSKDITPVQVAKLLPVLKTAVENAIGIESHTNRYFYDNTTVYFENLLGGYVDGEYFVPVRFGLKHSTTGEATLYVIVDQQPVESKKIKAEVVKIPDEQGVRAAISRSAFKVSVANLARFVNGKDLLRYLPDNMLNDGQIKTKWEGIAETIKKTNAKNDEKYAKFIAEGNLNAAQRMVDQAASAAFRNSVLRDKNGRLIKVYHGTHEKFNAFRGKEISGIGNYFSPWKSFAAEYGDVKAYYLNLTDPAIYDYDWNQVNDITEDKSDGFIYVLEDMEGGIDQNKVGDTEIVVYDSNKIKSADAVVYDDNGNVIPISERFNTEKDDFRYSERSGESVSNRSLLANAFEGISQNSVEYKMIQDYKGRIKELNELETKLHQLNSEIRQIRFGTEGQRDSQKLSQLEDEAKEVAKEINRYDKRLLNMEASEPLRRVVERERKKEAQRTKEHVKEIQQNKKARAEQAEMRYKIRKTVRDLDKILKRGNKKLNVKEDMKGFASKALELADYLFTDHISNDELIRRGITVAMRGNEPQLVKETEEILKQLYDNADSLTDEEFTRLDDKRKRNMEKLRELLKAQRNERRNTPVYNLFNDLVTEYANLKNSKQDAVKAAYNPDVERFLRSYIGESNGETDSDRKTLLQNMRVDDMTTDELWKLHNAYKMVLHAVRTANDLFVKNKAATIQEITDKITRDFSSRKMPEGKAATVIRNLSNKLGWNYEKLYYALDRIGSEAFTELVMNIANSENIVMQDVLEAAAFRDEMVKKYGFNNWDVNKEIGREFLDNNGKKFKLTLGQMMALYAYSRRDGAWDHIEYGGFVFGEAALTNPRPADSYKLSEAQCEAITGLLTKEQKGYVEAMQKFLSETMGEKGNEVSMMLYGIKMFGEKNYFPIHIAGQFKAQANESQAKAAAGFSSMSNAGFTHAQNPNAKAPFVLEGFNEIWVDHVNEMSRYHGTVPALEDMRRVMNRSSYSESGTESMAIKQLMENSYGKEAVDYFDNLYREANSGAITDKLQQKSKKLLSLFRKNSVAYSLSVLVQQPASLVRAYAMIDRKYFGFKGVGAITSGVAKAVSSKWNKAYENAYNEMMKYAPGVTLAKEIGGFDTATGGSIRSYLLDTDKSFKQKWKTGTAKEKGKAVMDIVDDNAIANLPNVADKIAWIEIWNACKRETVAKHKNLATSSDAFLQIVGDRFTEVIRATQVYDSIFAKSPMLKSKNLAVQYLVSFMNEPNTVANMAEKAVRDLSTKGNRMQGLRTAHVLIHSIIFTGVLKSFIYAMRDDDEDETYIEKYIESLAGSLMDDFNPLNYIPLMRDVVSLAQGYDVERSDMAIVADAVDALSKVIKNGFTETEDMTEEQLAAFDKKVTEANWKLAESLAAFAGIPVKNIRREINAFIDHARIASANAGMTTKKSAWDKLYEAVTDSIPFMQNKKSKQDKIYDVIMSGDKEYLERIKATYKTEDDYHTAVRTALRENDSRIREAALAHINGDPSERVRIARQIIADGFDVDDVILAINAEINKLTKDDKEETAKKVKGYYKAEDFVREAANGDTASLEAIREDIIQTALANGKTEEEAEKGFVSDIKSEAKKAYISGTLDDSTAEKLLTEYVDMDEEETAGTISYWAFQKAYPEYKDLSQSNVEGYYEFAEPSEIPLEVYVQYIEGTKGLVTIYDDWGDEVKSKREQVLEVIDSLPLTWQQKDALYLAAGYSESNIWDVPW